LLPVDGHFMLRFVTTNEGKVREAREYLDDGVKQLDFDYPEIQSDDLATVAAHGARAAYRHAEEPVIVDDAGLFIDAFDGFPGPYSAYVEDTVGVERVRRLTSHEDDRSAAFRGVIAYCDGEGFDASPEPVDRDRRGQDQDADERATATCSSVVAAGELPVKIFEGYVPGTRRCRPGKRTPFHTAVGHSQSSPSGTPSGSRRVRQREQSCRSRWGLRPRRPSTAPEVVPAAQLWLAVVVPVVGLGRLGFLVVFLRVVVLVVHREEFDFLGLGVVRVDFRNFHASASLGEDAVDEDDEAVLGTTDAGTTLVDVLDGHDDFLAELDRLLFQVADGLVVVATPLGAAAVTVVLTAHALDPFGETGALVREWTIRHGSR